MIKKILFFLIIPFFSFSQKTYIPDDNFEMALINQGLDNTLDDSVLTSSIDTLRILSVFNQNINSIEGIQDFDSLRVLRCSNNNIVNINLSSNTLLRQLYCGGNQIVNLNVSNNQLLTVLKCGNNLIPSLDLSNNSQLSQLFARNTFLISLNLRNGNNMILDSLFISGNPNLTCIEVNNVNYFNNNFNLVNINIDNQHFYSNNCNISNINNLFQTKIVEKIIDLSARNSLHKKNLSIIIYKDGTIEKRLIFD